MPELVAIPYSAWSLKARWSLDAHGIAYRYRSYLPMLGEPALRMRLRAPFQKASVPVLFAESGPLTDSCDIAEWAAANATNDTRLITDENRAEVRSWNERSERLLDAGRARTTRLIAGDPSALAESVPPPLDKLGPVTNAIGAMGARFILRKYRADRVGDVAAVSAMRSELEALRAVLEDRDTILSAFSYADVAMAFGFMFIAPPSNDLVRLGSRARPHWNCPELAAEFQDLVAWRATVFERWPRSTRGG